MKKIGLLVMSYGTPKDENDIERYYTHIRGGRVPAPPMIEALKGKYRKIGGITPLAKITNAQATKLVGILNENSSECEFILYLGYKHSLPYIEDAVKQMEVDGIDEAVGIVTAPHYSIMSVKDYQKRANEAVEKLSIKMVDSWYAEACFIKYWTDEIKKKLSETNGETKVFFTAHSLPEKIRELNDVYEFQMAESAKLIAEQFDALDYEIAWQSAAPTPIPWIGPDVNDAIGEVAKINDIKNAIVAPIGFVSDHLEILFDNDIECKETCEKVGMNYIRTSMPNDNVTFINAMASAIVKKMEG